MSLFIEDDDDEVVAESNTDLVLDVDNGDEANREKNGKSSGNARSPPSIPVQYREDDLVPVYPDREINCALPLKYQQEIVEDMLTKDALLILGRGLGWELLTANLLHALSSPVVELGKSQKKKSLVFVLNARDDEIVRLKDEFGDLSWLNNGIMGKFVVMAGDSSSSKRKAAYQEGGIISISTRVLVVDMLSGMVDPNDITGFFVLHAERIRETSNDAFIINLFRDKNDWGFIKAFSDEPESFTGFTPLATRLRVLRLENVLLWPRFHVAVTQSFNYHHRKKDTRKFVTEINVKLSYKMSKIQAALLTCTQACIGELKRHNPSLATEYWDMENVHDPDFAKKVRHSLDSQWHRLTFTTKQLLSDLATIIDLMNALLTVDSIAFYQTIKNIVDSNIKQQSTGLNRSMSPWLNLDESQTVISYAKERAIGQQNGEYILEELPKWPQLANLLDDILREKSSNTNDSNSSSNDGPILIMCTSKKVAHQLRKLLLFMKQESQGDRRRWVDFRPYMISRLHAYLSWKEVNKMVMKLNSELNENPEENVNRDAAEITVSKTFSRNGQPVSKRRRTRGASVAARVEQLHSIGNIEDKAQEDEDIKRFVDDAELGELGESEEFEGLDGADGAEGVEVGDVQPEFVSMDCNTQIIIQVYNDKFSASFLEELAPSHVIMYQPDLSFIRRVEIFQAINRDSTAKVYFMYYGDSIEEQKHLLRIKKEKEAFTRLIKEKANLSKHFETSDDNYKFQIKRNSVVNTRIAGGAQFRTESDEMRVVVDVREFGSSLPNLLYRIGIQVIPCMITVGDYIVSPRICVERKSIPDLISSFKSGRLYNQCEQMFRYYDVPTLLIEFDENKSFSLEPFSEAKFLKAKNNAVSSMDPKMRQNLQSQILSLLYSFPKLKIIWSSSPYETAQIFLELKSNQEEPDVGAALDKGVNRGVATQDGGPPVYNDDPIDFIQNIPGINNLNCHAIIQKVRNIEELVKLSEDEFKAILGNENGRKAHAFLNRKLY